jgi:hypothetical protein
METLVKKNGSFPVAKTFFDDFFTKDLFDWTDKNFAALGSNIPSVNLKETDTKLEVELAAPGMKKEDFKIEIEDNVLSLYLKDGVHVKDMIKIIQTFGIEFTEKPLKIETKSPLSAFNLRILISLPPLIMISSTS